MIPPTGSLRKRFFISTFVWIGAGLLFTGIMVSSLFRTYITDGFHEEMQIHIEELAALSAVDKTGQPFLLRRLSDPRFVPTHSGFYWEIRRDGHPPLRSPSLADGNISGTLATGPDKRWAITDGPMGKTLEYGMIIAAKTGGPPLHLSIASDLRVLDGILSDFNWPLGWELSVFAILMIGLGILQVNFSLRPLRRLKTAISDIREGTTARMEGDYPGEISPLVNDLNQLLDANGEMIRSARIQAGNLAHGLRTPLAILVDEAQQLSSRGESESADTLERECRRMQRYVDYYTARARTAALAKMPGQLASVRATLEPIISAMKRLHNGRDINICLGNFPDISLACDEVDLEEMTSNLIDNASKWAKSRVIVSWAHDASTVHIFVDDDGPGLAPSKRESVFNAGERLDEAVPGTGLGLTIVRDLVVMYKGSIRLTESTLGGLRSELHLPRR
jgi:signal transduction histidine kinase